MSRLVEPDRSSAGRKAEPDIVTSSESLHCSEQNSGQETSAPFRIVLLMHCLNLLVTWPLWQVRSETPMLPMWEWLPIDSGPWLIGLLLGCLFRPRFFLLIHTVFLLVAMSLDQMRLQPPVISHLILLWSLSGRGPSRLVGRAHLIALWFYAGFYKLVSDDFITGEVHWLCRSLCPGLPVSWEPGIGILIAAGEMALAVWAVIPATRLFASRLACGLHIGVIFVLSPIGLDWDPAVWPWNLSLAVSALVLFGESGSQRYECAAELPRFRGHAFCRSLAMIFLLLPIGYQLGFSETYLCHLLYSSYVPQAWIVTGDGDVRPIETRSRLHVPVPQIRRLYEEYFRAIERVGDRLVIDDPRSGKLSLPEVTTDPAVRHPMAN